MNVFDKILSSLGISTERFELMSEAEQANLRDISANQETLEQDLASAIEARDAATTRVTELEGQLTTANEGAEALQSGLTETQASLDAAQARIAELEKESAELNAALAMKPGEAATTVVSASGERLPGEKTKPIRSWEAPLYK